MIEEIGTHAISLGISGLLFVMWWHERQDRMRGTAQVQETLRNTRQVTDINERVLDVIQANTEALVALREELRAQREAQREAAERLARQLEQIAALGTPIVARRERSA